MELTFATGNSLKFGQAKEILQGSGITLKQQKVDTPEIQGTPREIAQTKIDAAYEEIKGPVIIDDVSVNFTALGNIPGPYMKQFLANIEIQNIPKLLDSFEDKSATVTATIAYKDEHGTQFFEGVAEGKLVTPSVTGIQKNFMSIFAAKEHDKPFSELTPKELEPVNHRAKAFKKLGEFLTKKET